MHSLLGVALIKQILHANQLRVCTMRALSSGARFLILVVMPNSYLMLGLWLASPLELAPGAKRSFSSAGGSLTSELALPKRPR
jgi:hypothetical protein